MGHLHMLKMNSAIKTTIALIILSTLSVLTCHGQKDSVKNFKNTIRFNITNPMLFSSKFNVIGYERVIKDYQTASINLGRSSFGTLLFNSDSLETKAETNDKGFNLSVDYRFYLKKENKFQAPRGAYIGPYYAYNFFSRDITWDLLSDTYDGEVVTGTNVNAHFIGAQLGYQFVFWNRLSVDIILMGPGLWHFNVKTGFDTNLSEEDETMVLEKLNEMLQENFPGSDLVFTGEGFEASKNTSTSSMGFRYMINLGFRF